MTAHTAVQACAVTRRETGPELSVARLAQVRSRARDMIRDETRSVVQLWGWAGRDTHRAMLLAHVTGYLNGYCDQVDRDPDTDPREIVAVLRGVLDAVTTELRPPRTRALAAVDPREGR
jgi:hypothetical protein